MAISIGDLIRERREEFGLSQNRLASEAGVSAAQISRLESGERGDPSFEMMVRLAEALHTSLDELAGPLRADLGVDAKDWKRAGFDQVDEIVPGRHYEVWGDHRQFRVLITRAIERGSSIRWNSSIDEAVSIPDPTSEYGERLRVWTSPVDIPARLLGDTPAMALRDAMRWLADWGGFDEIGRARRDAAAAQNMQPELRAVVDAIDCELTDLELATWRDERRARWSNSTYDVYISRQGEKQFVMMTYFKDASKHAKPVARFPLNKSGALEGAARIRIIVTKGN
jgi:transcriptional regulator with XRE-family HTH domain